MKIIKASKVFIRKRIERACKLIKNQFIFKKINNDGFNQSFYGIDKINKTKHYFIQNFDFDQQKRLRDELKFLSKYPGAMRMEFAVRFEKEFMFKPREDALVNFGDTIFHFNFKDGKIIYYTGNELVKIGEVDLDDQLKSSIWNNTVFFDKARQKSYLIFKDRLFEINRLNGQIIQRNSVLPSAKQIINGGYLYYLNIIQNPFRYAATISREKIM